MPSRPRMSPRRVTLIGFFAAIVLAVPMGVLASHQFTDVPDDYPYHADIDALVDSGVTGGCGGGKYCPASYVTRGQMAAFLNRLGALGPGKTPVANATTVDFWDANELTRAAYASSGNLADGDVVSSVALTANITAPAPGWLLIDSNAELYNESSDNEDAVVCQLEINNTLIAGTDTTTDTDYDATVNNDEVSCSPTGAIDVCGGAHAIDLQINSIGPEVNVFDAFVTVQYVPFNGVGDIKPFFPDCIIIIPLDEEPQRVVKE